MQALEAKKSSKMAKCYLDWDDWLKTQASGNTPYTPIVPMLHGLKESLALMRAEGFENVVKRHNR